MRFSTLDAAEGWLTSIEGWFETRGGDDGEGVVTERAPRWRAGVVQSPQPA